MDQEKPYTIAEVSALMGLSKQTVTRIFERERGVIVYEEQRPRKRASYRVIRVPRHVFKRVVEEMTIK